MLKHHQLISTGLFALALLMPASLCMANALDISGSIGIIQIKRSVSDNWSSDNGLRISAENTEVGLHKITIDVTSADPNAWYARSLRVSIDDEQSWRDISPTIFFHQGNLVINGTLMGNFDFISNMSTGVYPSNILVYESRANLDAVPGPADLTVTYTLLSQF